MIRNTSGLVVLILLIGAVALLSGCENPTGGDSVGEGGPAGDGVLTIDLEEPDIPQLVLAGAVDEVPAGEELTLTLEGTFSSHRWFLDGLAAHPALSSAGNVATVDTGLVTRGVHTVGVIVAEGYSGLVAFSVVDPPAE